MRGGGVKKGQKHSDVFYWQPHKVHHGLFGVFYRILAPPTLVLPYCYLFGQKTSISRCPSHEKLNLGLLMGLEWYTTTDYHFLIPTENERYFVLFYMTQHVWLCNDDQYKAFYCFFYTLDRTPYRLYWMIRMIINW